jgi:outer membrane biosynthesis protein TonB
VVTSGIRFLDFPFLRFCDFPILFMSGTGKKFAILVFALLAFLSGCKKNKPPVPPPQTQAPTITQPEPQPQPSVQPQPQPEPPATTTTAPPAEQKPSPATVTKPKPHKPHVAKKPAPTPEKNKTVKEGGETAPTGQLSAGIPPNEANRQRQTAAQLRQNSENSLRSITRALSSDEQAMVQQIRAYIAQSRSADNDGDTERAYNLAVKANLLTGELMKR